VIRTRCFVQTVEGPTAASAPRDPRRTTLQDLAEALSTPKKRLQFMISRHQQTIEDFDRQREILDQRIRDAEEAGSAVDARDYTKMRQALTTAAAEYDLKMSKGTAGLAGFRRP